MNLNLASKSAPFVLLFEGGRPTIETVTPETIARLQSVLHPARAAAPKAPLVRYAVTKKPLPKTVTAAIRTVHAALARAGDHGLDTPTLAKRVANQMALNTVRWAVQVLRQKGVVRTLP